MIINLRSGSYEADMQISEYANGRTAIALFDEEDGQPLVTATTNVPDLPEEEIDKLCKRLKVDKRRFLLIKDWSENEGVYDSLVEDGVILPTPATVPTGYVSARVAFLREEIETYMS